MSQRMDRVDALLREEIGAILAREVADPRIGFATITGVATTPDLRHAQIWVSVIGQQSERDVTLTALGRAMPFVRRALGSRLRLKRIPELHLRLDDTAERGTRVLHLLAELDAGRTPDAEPPLAESLPTPVRRLPHEGDAPEPAGVGETPHAPQRRRPRGSGAARGSKAARGSNAARGSRGRPR